MAIELAAMPSSPTAVASWVSALRMAAVLAVVRFAGARRATGSDRDSVLVAWRGFMA